MNISHIEVNVSTIQLPAALLGSKVLEIGYIQKCEIKIQPIRN